MPIDAMARLSRLRLRLLRQWQTEMIELTENEQLRFTLRFRFD